MDGNSLERRVMTDKEKGRYEYRLKLEDNRERKWRMSQQGAFVSSMQSFDALMETFEDPSSIRRFSDHGRGARQICRENTEDILAEAMKLLIKRDDQIAKEEKESPATKKKKEPKRARERAKDLAFIKAVLEHKNHADLGITEQGFNWKLRKIEEKFSSILLSASPQKGRFKN